MSSSDLTLTDGVARQYDYWLTVYKRTWKATVASSFLSPIFYVLAMGVVLGGFIEGDPDRLEGATSYLAFLVPGLIATHAMQTAIGETTYPVMGALKWHKSFHAQLATPLAPAHLAGAMLAFVGFRIATTCGVFMLVLAPFGLFETWWGALVAFAAQVLVGMAFASVVFAFSCWVRSEASFGLLFRLGVFPLALFSGAFFPITNLGPVLEWLARLTPLWHGVNLSRMFALDHVDWSIALVNTGVLVAMTALGWWLSVRTLTRRLVT